MKSVLYSVVVVFLAGGAFCSDPKQQASKPDPTPPSISANPGGANVPDTNRERKSDDPPSYSKDIQPFLATHCVQCHNGKKAKAGYNFERFDGLTRGGKKGPALVAGEPDKSLVVRVLNGQGKKMPPPMYEHQPKAEDVDVLKAWIAAGAKDDTEKSGG
jgi:hypothetical protein